MQTAVTTAYFSSKQLLLFAFDYKNVILCDVALELFFEKVLLSDLSGLYFN